MAYAARMSNLESQLQDLVSQFVGAIVGALRSAPLDEIIELEGGPAPEASAARGRRRTATPGPAAAAPRPARPGRRHRASAAEVEAQKKIAFDTARTLKPGFSKGDVMRKSGSDVDLGRALTLLVTDGKLRKQGERRMTRYWVK